MLKENEYILELAKKKKIEPDRLLNYLFSKC